MVNVISGLYSITPVTETITVGSWNRYYNTSTFDPANTSGAIILSNGNLTATQTGGSYDSAKSTLSYSTGKQYCEFTINTDASNLGVGCCNSSYSNTDPPGYPGAFAWTNTSGIYLNGSHYTGSANNLIKGSIIGMAVDLNNHLVWVTSDGVNWNTSYTTGQVASGVGGYDISSLSTPLYAVADQQGSGGVITLNAGAVNNSFAYTVPTGFNPYW